MRHKELQLTHSQPEIPPASRFFHALTRHVPTSLAVREVMRYQLLRELLLAQGGGRIWDVGCGDGSFWTSVPEREGFRIDGIELDPKEAAIGRSSGAFAELAVADITTIEPEAGVYDLVLGNCSLEHIPDIREALVRMRRGLRPDGRLLLFVPAPQWTRSLALIRGLGRLSNRAGMAFGYALDGFFQHHHLFGHPVWNGLLASLGYENIQAQGLGGRHLNQTFARHLPVAASDFLWKSTTGHYLQSPLRRRSLTPDCLVELGQLPLPPEHSDVVEYAILADRGSS